MKTGSGSWTGSARGVAMAAACAFLVSIAGIAPAPAESAPVPAATDTPAPAGAAPAAPAAPQADTPPAPGLATPSLPTLVPPPGNAGDVDEVVLPAKPAAVAAGRAKWDEAFKALHDSLDKLRTFLAGAGVKVAGRPLVRFLETDDTGFRYETVLPVDAPPAAGAAAAPEGIRFGETPSGRAMRFVHKGPYDEIDSTYEAVTAYLDAKNIAVRDIFTEEYVTDVASSDDAGLEVYIYVQPKEGGASAPSAPAAPAPPAAPAAPDAGSGQAPKP